MRGESEQNIQWSKVVWLYLYTIFILQWWQFLCVLSRVFYDFFGKGLYYGFTKGINMLKLTSCLGPTWNATRQMRKKRQKKDLQHMKVGCVWCIKSNSGGFWHCFRPFQLAVSLKDQLASIWTAKYLNFFFCSSQKLLQNERKTKKQSKNTNAAPH